MFADPLCELAITAGAERMMAARLAFRNASLRALPSPADMARMQKRSLERSARRCAAQLQLAAESIGGEGG
jgi:hypothetical protein